MLGFPLPYKEELIYSTVARAKIHFCIQSPKELLDAVYGDRQVVATVDFPSHLEKIAKHYYSGMSSEQLIYDHTLFPLYAPFIPEDRRQGCIKWLQGHSKSSVHLVLGIAASRLPQYNTLQFCPGCFQSQIEEFGECFWQRAWQVFGVDCCLRHGKTVSTSVKRHSLHRHEYVPATLKLCEPVSQIRPSANEVLVARQVSLLLSRPLSISPVFNQWTQYYKRQIRRCGFNKGGSIDYESIRNKVVMYWGNSWLSQHGLKVTQEQSCWLRAICRKHRKSFSYLEHIVLLAGLLPENWLIEQVLREVLSLPKMTLKTRNDDNEAIISNVPKRDSWLKGVRELGPRQARMAQKALYAWLYRNDRDWLLAINKKYKNDYVTVNKRVDWVKRDRIVAKKLLKIKNKVCEELYIPRLTKAWYLTQVSHSASIEKNIHRLPLCNFFFNRYSERVSDYQIRRLTRSVVYLIRSSQPVSKWKLLRLSGLSKHRLRPATHDTLAYMMEKYG